MAFTTPKGNRRGTKYQAIYQPLGQQAVQQQRVKAEQIVDDNWVDVIEDSNDERSGLRLMDPSETTVEPITDVEMANAAPLPSPPLPPPSMHEQLHSPIDESKVFHHHLADRSKQSKAKLIKSLGQSAESIKTYEKWKALLDTHLVCSMLEYENFMAGKPALTENDVVWTRSCITPTCNPKTAQVFCLLWCRKFYQPKLPTITLALI
jgi:hypothetical protein